MPSSMTITSAVEVERRGPLADLHLVVGVGPPGVDLPVVEHVAHQADDGRVGLAGPLVERSLDVEFLGCAFDHHGRGVVGTLESKASWWS